MVKETSKKVFKQKNLKFEKKFFLTFLSPKGVAHGYPLARPPKQNLKIASVRPPKMSKDTSMQNFKPLGLVDVSGDILGSTFWLRSFNYEDSCILFFNAIPKNHLLMIWFDFFLESIWFISILSIFDCVAHFFPLLLFNAISQTKSPLCVCLCLLGKSQWMQMSIGTMKLNWLIVGHL